MGQRYKFIIELQAPTDPANVPAYFNKIKHLFSFTRSVSIASKSFCDSVSGFDFSYNLASYLLDQDDKLDILFHLTCYDLNMVTIKPKLTLLKQLGIRKLLVVSGDSYEQSANDRLRKLQYANSHELAGIILRDYNWFESIGVAGYPGGNGKDSRSNEEECNRLAGILSVGASEVYTQCVFDSKLFIELDHMLFWKFPSVCVVPSVALFKNESNLDLISRLTRVTSVNFKSLQESLQIVGPREAESHSIRYIRSLCSYLFECSPRLPITIDLCTFGHFDLAQKLMVSLNEVEQTNQCSSERA